jgi:hypothetical protein
MTSFIQNRSRILIVHGCLALCLGLALFYLRSIMTNCFLEAIAVGIALLLVAVTLILAGVVDWYGAWSEGLRHLFRFIFYLLAGFVMAVAGMFLGIYSQICMPTLLFFAAFHALAFGLLAIIVAWKTTRHGLEQGAMYFFGIVSVVFSIVMTEVSGELDNHSATTVLGAYLCFVAAKLFFIACSVVRSTEMAQGRPGIESLAHRNLSAVQGDRRNEAAETRDKQVAIP